MFKSVGGFFMRYRLLAALLLSVSAQAADLPWDLTYQSVLRDRPDARRELGPWFDGVKKAVVRPPLDQLDGAKIEAALLIEQPAPVQGGVATTWLVATRDGAQVCVYGTRLEKQSCRPIDRARADGIIGDLLNLREPAPPAGKPREIADNYIGLMSLYLDGRGVQRPLAKAEWIDCDAEAAGRSGKMALPAILERTQLTDAEIVERDRQEAAARSAAPSGIRPSRMCPARVPAASQNDRPRPPDVEDAETKARKAIATETGDLLKARDYAGLEKLHRKLNSDKVRTPSGVWSLAVFYATLRDYAPRTRDMDYWQREDAQAARWSAKFPRSEVAPVFQVYLKQNRALAFRGMGNYADIRKEDIAPMNQAVKEGLALLDARDRIPLAKRDKVDGGWYRARMDLLPYSELFHSHFSYAWQGATRMEPDYHEVYFASAYYSLPKWNGAPDAVERMARLASTGKGTDRDAMYARVYWYLNQTEYRGKIFEDSMVDWNDMKTSFEALVRAYPVPWNLNAYAYFACKAGDYDVMSALMKRIGDDVVYGVWGNGGEAEYQRCAGNIGADTRNFAADMAARTKRLQGLQYDRLIGYAIVQRERFRNAESLRALQTADEIGRKLWNRPGMKVYYHKARALDNLARYDEEIEALQEGLKSQPGYPSAIFQMGLAYEGLKRKDDARERFELSARRIKEELSKPGVDRTPDVEKELTRMRKKLAEYDIDPTGI